MLYKVRHYVGEHIAEIFRILWFKGHQRMVCSTAWGEETNAKASCNLFSCGFDRRVLGWQVREEKDK